MGGVASKAPPPLAATCCSDLIREFMYITATERGERGGRRREEEAHVRVWCVCIIWKENTSERNGLNFHIFSPHIM